MTQEQPVVIDARGLNCPLPVLRLRKRLMDLAAGREIELLASDPATQRDVPVFCAAHGHVVARVEKDGLGTIRFYLRKSPSVA